MSKNKENIKDIKYLLEKVKSIESFDLFKEALVLSNLLEKELKDNKLIAEDITYFDILYKLKWIALSRISNKTVIELFKKHFVTIFNIDNFDIERKFKSKLINDIFVDDRDDFKKQIKKSLLENDEKLTSQNIMVNQKIIAPSVANWLRDFNIYMRGANIINNEKKNEYLSYNENVKKTTEQDREKLKVLINFYERLKYSSLSQAGLEESFYMNEDGSEGIVGDGTFTKINSRDANQLEMLNEIINKAKYPGIKPEKIKTTKADITKITPQERQQYKQEKVDKLENEFSEELEKKAIEEEVLNKVDDEHIQVRKKELEEMAKQYKVGSLERWAVEEELDKL